MDNIYQGSALIKSRLPSIPSAPGVYQMFNADKQVIYIGKAKNLKKRLTNYIKTDLQSRTIRMVSLTRYLEYIISNSEVEALLLEAQLIKQCQPKFNILLKDDKSFPYIKFRLDHDYPQLIKYRGKISSGEFFGPYTSSGQVDVTILELQKIFKLRPCSDNYFANRQRPCLQYQIGRCSAPCVNKITKDDYANLVSQARDFLTGKTQKLQEILAQNMERLSSEQRFEEASEIRDRIKAISHIQLKSGLQNSRVVDADVIAVVEKDDHYCLQIFIYRSGIACGSKYYFPVHTEERTKTEVLESFIGQFYQSRAAPKEIILNHPVSQPKIIAAAINKLHGNQVIITVPLRGEKMPLVKSAEANAGLTLEQHLRTSLKMSAIFLELQARFNLKNLPSRLEIYDNSHIMGAFAIGAMVVSTPLGFDKKEYRLFNIKSESRQVTAKNQDYDTFGGDDYNMLQEVLTRRFTRLINEPHKTPDLIIIDGGKGHMSVVVRVMQHFNLNIPVVCMSKGLDRFAGREQFHLLDQAPFTIDKNQPIMKYLQILRDEAHNFAIKGHRLQRSKAIKISSLDSISSVGEVRKKALLNYFGSYQAVCQSSMVELSKVHGISTATAKKIFEALK